MSGAIPPFPNTPSWCGAQLKHRDNFTFLPFTCMFRFLGVKQVDKRLRTETGSNITRI
jgi:hypothetical protein